MRSSKDGQRCHSSPQRMLPHHHGGHLLLCLLLVVTLALHLITQPAAAIKCTTFTPTACWFKPLQPATKAPQRLPQCSQEPCEFEQSALKCPFFTSGTYATKDADDCDTFMQVSARESPSSGKACYGGVVPGGFVSHAEDGAARDYVPSDEGGCRYHHHRRHEVMERLLGGNTDIVVAGDSMMRQFYLRFLQQLRGRRRVFDYRVHTHAKYAYCDEADVFDNTEYTDNMKQPGKDYLLNIIPEFFEPLSKVLPASLQACRRTPSRVDFLHAPLFTYQVDALRAYAETMRRPGRELIVITYLGVWTKAANVPAKYLALLEELHPKALLVTVSVPTFHEKRHPDVRAKYLQRNQRMAEWGAQYPGRVLNLDYDRMSHADNPPPNTINWDKHYMCYVTYPRAGSDASGTLRKTLLAANGLRERAFGNPVGDIWHTTDGQCYDEMNRNLWVVLLNAIMQTEGGSWLLPPASAIAASPETDLDAIEGRLLDDKRAEVDSKGDDSRADVDTEGDDSQADVDFGGDDSKADVDSGGDGSKADVDTEGDDSKADVDTEGDGSKADVDTEGDDSKADVDTEGDGSMADVDTEGDKSRADVDTEDDESNDNVSTKGDGSHADVKTKGDDSRAKFNNKGDDSRADVDTEDDESNDNVSAKGDGSHADVKTKGDDSRAKFNNKGDDSRADATTEDEKSRADVDTGDDESNDNVSAKEEDSVADANTKGDDSRADINTEDADSKADVSTEDNESKEDTMPSRDDSRADFDTEGNDRKADVSTMGKDRQIVAESVGGESSVSVDPQDDDSLPVIVRDEDENALMSE